jgi:hypothetical protein
VYEFKGSHAIIDHLSRYGADYQVTLCIRVQVPRFRARKIYNAFLDLLDDQPAVSYTVQSEGRWWSRRQSHLIIAIGPNSALQTAIHLLECRHGVQGG